MKGGDVTRRRLVAVVAAVLVAAAAIPAVADQYCNPGETCIWGAPNYGGDFWDPSTSDPDWPMWGRIGVQNDDDSIRNLESKAVRVFDGNYYTGGVKYCVPAGAAEDDIHYQRDNDGNSHYLWSGPTCPSGDPGP